MLTKNPLVSIIIPTYNRGQFIQQAIDSALSQDYGNFEVIISDNCSTDNTKDIVARFENDQRVKYYLNNTNVGLGGNFKIATIERAKGEYITYLGSDDYYCNNKFISQAVNIINTYPDVFIIAAKTSTYFTETNEIITDEKTTIFKNEFINGLDIFMQFPKWFFPGWGGAIFLNREKLISTKAFESKSQSLDYEANLKLMLIGNAGLISDASYVWRVHAKQASGSTNLDTQINNLDFIENTYSFAKQLNLKINLEQWRKQTYISYLHGSCRRMINEPSKIKKLLQHVYEKNSIRITLFNTPKVYLLFIIYRYYNIMSPILKLIYPSLYNAIERDKI